MTEPAGVEIAIQNPSPFWRGGTVVTPWKPIAEKRSISDKAVHLIDTLNDAVVPGQVDRIDRSDPERAVLVFTLPGAIEPGLEDYGRDCARFIVEEGVAADVPDAGIIDVTGKGVKLINEHLEAWLTLAADPCDDGRNWFGGAFTSIQVDRLEMLDAIAAVIGIHHDPEKRLQLDRIQIPRPPWAPGYLQYETMFDKSYRIESQTTGPVRASVTIASEPFSFVDKHPHTKVVQEFECSLHRVLSVYRGGDYIGEDVYLKAIAAGGTFAANFSFSAGYFLQMDLSLRPRVTHHPYVPDWFAVACDPAVAPRHGYAFATDRHSGHVYNPPPHYPNRDTEHKAFAWRIGPGKAARNVHTFKHGTLPESLSEASGQAWYEHIFKPMQARVL